MRKKAKAQDGKKKLKVKDLPVGRKAGSVKGGGVSDLGQKHKQAIQSANSIWG